MRVKIKMKSLDNKRLKEICKMGQGKNCCRYIIADPDEGIVCAKGTSIQYMLDNRVNEMKAKGDNCEGLN